jgi:hypothetical protein
LQIAEEITADTSNMGDVAEASLGKAIPVDILRKWATNHLANHPRSMDYQLAENQSSGLQGLLRDASFTHHSCQFWRRSAYGTVHTC